MTQNGILYYKSAASEKAQGFFPKEIIVDVKVIAPPENMQTLLHKIRRLRHEK